MISKSDIFSHFDFLTFFWLQAKLKYLGKFGFREMSQKRMDTKCKTCVKSKLGEKQHSTPISMEIDLKSLEIDGN